MCTRYSDLSWCRRNVLFCSMSALPPPRRDRSFSRGAIFLSANCVLAGRVWPGAGGSNGNKTNCPPCAVCLLKRSGGSRPHICLIIARFLSAASACRRKKAAPVAPSFAAFPSLTAFRVLVDYRRRNRATRSTAAHRPRNVPHFV